MNRAGGRRVRITGLDVFLRAHPCSHACRYCSIGERRISRVNFDRFFGFIDRLASWYAARRGNFVVRPWVNYTFDYNVELGRRLDDMLRCFDRPAVRIVPTGGLKFRDQSALGVWLDERRKIGAVGVHASFAGYGGVHDFYNGREGDFEHLLTIQGLAVERGMETHQSAFLSRRTLPLISGLLDYLKGAGVSLEYFSTGLFSYLGSAKQLEADRICEDDFGLFPEFLLDVPLKRCEWKSERTWLRYFQQYGDDEPEVQARLVVDEDNIDELEKQPIETSIEELLVRTRYAHSVVPPLSVLIKRYGNSRNLRIYESAADIDRMLVDRWLEREQVVFERQLTLY